MIEILASVPLGHDVFGGVRSAPSDFASDVINAETVRKDPRNSRNSGACMPLFWREVLENSGALGFTKTKDNSIVCLMQLMRIWMLIKGPLQYAS